MVDCIIPKKDVLDLYRKQKSEFNFHQRSDDDFIIFLLDTTSRVLSIAHQLTPVIEAVSYEAESQQMETGEAEETESQENIMPKSDLEADQVPIQPLPEVQSHTSTTATCKIETMSCQDDAIFQLAKEIESVANTLLDEQCNNTILSSELSNSKSLPSESEKLITDPSDNKKSSPLSRKHEKNFKPSVTPLPYSMLDMANIQNDSNINTSSTNSDNTLDSLSLVPGSKRSSLSSKPTERFCESKVYQVDPKGNCHELIKSKQRRCKICHKIRRKSCSICDVGLCQQECFRSFHLKFADYNIYVEKFQCFGKNHRARINNLPYGVHKLITERSSGHPSNLSSPDLDSKRKKCGSLSSGDFQQTINITMPPVDKTISQKIDINNHSNSINPNAYESMSEYPGTSVEAKNFNFESQNASIGNYEQASHCNTNTDSSVYDLTKFVNSFESTESKVPDADVDKTKLH